MEIIKKLNWKKILLYYSTGIITISLIGGVYIQRRPTDFFTNLLFLPVAVYLWQALIKSRRGKKNES